MKTKKIISISIIICSIIICFNNIKALAMTDLNGYHWDDKTIKYFVNNDITKNYNATVRSNLVYGIQSWSGNAGYSLSSTTSEANSRININMSNFGATGWDGQTRYNATGTTMYLAEILINSYYYSNNYSSYPNLWKAIGCHEAGHALGLKHNTTVGESSIMKEYTTDYYNINASNPRLTSPQTADLTALKKVK